MTWSNVNVKNLRLVLRTSIQPNESRWSKIVCARSSVFIAGTRQCTDKRWATNLALIPQFSYTFLFYLDCRVRLCLTICCVLNLLTELYAGKKNHNGWVKWSSYFSCANLVLVMWLVRSVYKSTLTSLLAFFANFSRNSHGNFITFWRIFLPKTNACLTVKTMNL